MKEYTNAIFRGAVVEMLYTELHMVLKVLLL